MARRLALALALVIWTAAALAVTLADLPLSGFTSNPLVKVVIRGFLDCSLPPDQPVRSPPIAGVNVILQCGPERATVADAVTDALGVFVLIVQNAFTTLFNSAQPCRVVARLPIARCEILPPNGTLEAPLTLVGTLLDPILGGLVGTFQAGAFQLFPLS